MRNPNYQIKEGYKRHASIGLFIEGMLECAYPWHRLRSAQKLLRLSDKYGSERVARVCERFQRYGVYDVPRLQRVLMKEREVAMTEGGKDEQGVISLSTEGGKPARFERSGSSFNHAKALNSGLICSEGGEGDGYNKGIERDNE